MPYRGGYNNYDFVISPSFSPFTMQEMLVPFTAYKEAFDKSEEAYTDLKTKADTFKYLSTIEGDSEAKAIYNNYANELNAQAEDLASNGLTMNNRRALTKLKQRYQGEIGMLDEAKKALDRETLRRLELSSKDPSMLYGLDTLNIDQFLYNKTPNLYGISGNELYAKGAAAGKANSSRVYGAPNMARSLDQYYKDYVQSMGYTPEDLYKFGEQISADFAAQVSVLPELQKAANQILEANGVTENLTGNNLKRAQQQVIRGIIDGAVYTETHNPMRDEGKLSKYQQETLNRSDREFQLQLDSNGFEAVKDENGKVIGYKYNEKLDPRKASETWMWEYNEEGRRVKPSKEYEEAVKKGLLRNYNNTNSGSGRTTTRNNSGETVDVTLQDDFSFDLGTGKVEVLHNHPNYNGEVLSDSEKLNIIQSNPALQRYLHTDQYPEIYKKYNFIKNENVITIYSPESKVKFEDSEVQGNQEIPGSQLGAYGGVGQAEAAGA